MAHLKSLGADLVTTDDKLKEDLSEREREREREPHHMCDHRCTELAGYPVA